MQSQYYWIGSGGVMLLGILFCVSYSKTAFDQPISVLDFATPPRHLAHRRPFFLERAAIVVFCLLAYAFVLVFQREIPALIQLAPSMIQSALSDFVKAISDENHPSWLITVVAITIGFAYYVKTDFRATSSIIFGHLSIRRLPCRLAGIADRPG